MKTQTGKIRIISGEHKGSVLQFPAVNGLRPTPDRTRETLFNWLAPYISGSTCLDLFAGSGSLGLEALSRGAKKITFVEANRHACRALESNIQKLKNTNAMVLNQDSSRYLRQSTTQFDVVFLDPPFNSSLLQSSIDLIDENNLLKNRGWIYTEFSAHQEQPECPQRWKIHRQTKAGDVRAKLFEFPA